MQEIVHQHKTSEDWLAIILGVAAFASSFVLAGLTIVYTLRSPIVFESLRPVTANLSSVVAFAVVAITYLKKKNEQKTVDTKHWWLFLLILGVTISLFAGEVSVVILYTLTRSFRDLALDPISATLLIATGEGLFAYLLSLEIEHFNLKKLGLLLMFFSLTGLLITGAYHYDPRWWAGSLCALGMGIGYTGVFYVYNTTVVLASLLMLLAGFYIQPYLTNIFEQKIIKMWQLRALQFLYLLVILLLFLVGLIPFGHQSTLSQIHYFAGNYSFGFVGLAMLLTYILIPKQGWKFYLVNYGILALGLVFYYFYDFAHYFTITFYELNSIILIALWMVYLYRHLKKISI